MNLSAVFIRRPVMTTLVTLAIILVGAIGFFQLPINSMPKVELPTLSVTASLPGASPETMATTVATVLERQFSAIAGIDSMNSSSMLGVTTITLQFNLDRSIDPASQDVQTAISAALPLLPPMPTSPVTKKVNPGDMPIMFLELTSPTLPMSRLDEYAQTLIGQRLSMLDGVAQVQVIGSQKYAVRVQVDPDRLSSAGIGIDQVASAITGGTVKKPTGLLSGSQQAYTIQSNDQLLNAAAFRPLIVAVRNGVPLRLESIASVLDDVENNQVFSCSKHGQAIILAIYRQPNTNTVQIVDEVRALLPGLRAQMPLSVRLDVLVDRSLSIRESVRDVGITLAVTVVLVVAVIFLFLRNLSATAIPALSLPACIIGTFAVMALLDFCLDDISLMALTLCVGFVVDDSIVVLEAVVRRLELGHDPMTAALEGSQEVAFTVVSMTLSLVAVFVPLLFLGGLVGRVFREFAVTITAAILISGFVSLSLTPMLCSRFLKPPPKQRGWLYHLLERGFERILQAYRRTLIWTLRWRFWVLLAAVALLGLTFYLGVVCPKGFIPTADTGYIFGNTEAAQAISFDDMVLHQSQVADILQRKPYVENFMSAVGGGLNPTSLNTGRVFIGLKPRSQRRLTADQIIQDLRREVAGIAGLKLYMQNPPAIRLGGQSTKGLYQLTLLGTDLSSLYQGVDRLLARLKETPEIQDPTQDVQPRGLQARVEVDRDKAYSLGLTSLQIDQALAKAYGSGQTAMLYTADNEYQVILQVKPRFYAGPDQLDRLFVRARGGKLVPLRAFARVVRTFGPLTVTHFGQLPSATISFNLKPGNSLSQAVDKIMVAAAQVLPNGVTASLQGNAQAFQSAMKDMLALLVVAVLIIYIVLGILYESFIHPLTILAGLPSAGLGAILMLLLCGRDLDVYGVLGLILLIGIVKKNAIMMIDHALECERTQNMPPEAAILDACLVRFRPIFMTTVAALMGSLPMATGWGAGGEARQPLGLAVAGGLLVSQLLTLYITPVVYLYLDRWLNRGRHE